ncbi:uncharacterized protein [Amphiura filiformis]|uniref:uncharacterized protein n=1 Tax=Amphiura filiformis TaxID=82378 RepID=UPI003B20BD50
MSMFPESDPEAPLIPPKRSSGSSTGSSGSSNGHTTPTSATVNGGTMDTLKIFKEAGKVDFYHGILNNKEVEKILRPHLQIKGSYLLRKSNRNPGALTFSVVHTKKHIYHFNVFFAKGKFTVTESLAFLTLGELITHFETNEIPGDGTPGLFLQHPISKPSKTLPVKPERSPNTLSPNSKSLTPSSSPRINRTQSPKPSPMNSPVVQRRVPDAKFDFPVIPVSEARQNAAAPVPVSAPADPGNRPPMPIPRVEPIYDSTQHKYGIYAVPDDPDRDRFYDIRDLCARADEEIAKQAKKCTCGLYLFESTLVDNWMMHRDIENTATKGKIFFVNTVTNEATWQLPERIRRIMEETQAEKWKKIKALIQRENARTEASADL